MGESRVWAALLRLAVGAVWLFEWYPQLSDRETYLSQGFSSMVNTMAGKNPFGFYRAFLQDVVLPHASLFAYLTLIGGLLVGICLLIGLLTPCAAGVAMILNINYALAAGWISQETHPWMSHSTYSLNVVLFFAEIIVIAMAAGQIVGVDAILGQPSSRRANRRF